MIEIVDTTDFDEYTDAQRGWETCYRPTRPESLEARMISGNNGSIQVDFDRWNSPLEITGVAPEGALSVVVPLHHSNSYLSSGLAVTADHVDIFVPGSEVFAIMKQPISLMALTISTETLDRRINSRAATVLAECASEHAVINSTRQATDELRRWGAQLLQRFARGPIPAELDDQLVDETLLVIARTLNSIEEKRKISSASYFRLARRTRDYMLEQKDRPPTIPEVCDFLNCSERTLHRIFTDIYGVSPKRFLKTRHLFAIHQKLKSAAPGERVSDIATRHGFWDLGYFAQDYKAMFGELPSITLRKTRG